MISTFCQIAGGQTCDTLQLERDRYSVSLLGMYGYNHTWKSYGGFDLKGHIPVNRHFEMDAAFEYNSGSVCALTAVARPMFQLPVGEMFLDGALHCRFFVSPYDLAWFSMAASVGYRMDYVSAQLGIISNSIIDLAPGSADKVVAEPFNLLYRLAVNVRPYTSCWNISLGIADYTDYEYERTWEPMLFVHGHYTFLDHFSALLDVDFKSAGAFHLNNHFWGIGVRTGFRYIF